MKLIVSVDTEEDNWLPFSRSGYTAKNVEQIPRLQRIFAELGVRPTYLITYQVATNATAAAILNEIAQSETAEIGTHCHPWNQPPFEEASIIENSMLCNLPDDLQIRKIEHLHGVIQQRFGFTPTSFRSGRWGYSPAVARALLKLNYKVDSSITAFTDWTVCHGPDFSMMPSRAYRFDVDDIYKEKVDGALLEIPASVGYLQSNTAFSHRVHEAIRRSSLKRLRLLGILHGLGWLNQVGLSPEISTLNDMVNLLVRLREQNYQFATLWFHSSTLVPGLTPFVKSRADAEAFLQRIRELLAVSKDLGIESVTLTETANAGIANRDARLVRGSNLSAMVAMSDLLAASSSFFL